MGEGRARMKGRPQAAHVHTHTRTLTCTHTRTRTHTHAHARIPAHVHTPPSTPLRSESWETFRYVTQMTNWAWGVREAARVTGAVLMWQVGKKMPTKYGITGDLREALYR